jgi:two-component system NtrC family sensor kinase
MRHFHAATSGAGYFSRFKATLLPAAIPVRPRLKRNGTGTAPIQPIATNHPSMHRQPIKSLLQQIDHRLLRAWILPLLAWTLIVGISLALLTQSAERTARTIARTQGSDVFRMIEATRVWNAKHGGVLVTRDEWTPANPYLVVPERDPVTPSGRQLTTLNPAYMTRQLAEVIEKEADIRIHITSLKPINPGNGPDAWEQAALQAFEGEDSEERSEFVEHGGQVLSRYMAPLITKPPCLKCHREQGYEVGDIRGGISVTQDAGPLLEAMQSQVRGHFLTHGVVWLLGVAAMLTFALYRDRKEKELEHSQQRLAQNERMVSLGSLVAGVAHEVNTPLGVSVTAASMVEEAQAQIQQQLRQETLTQEDLEAKLGTIGEAAGILSQNLQRAAKLISSFKQLAVDQNTTELRTVNIDKLLEEVFTTYHNQLKKLPVDVRIDCPADLVMTTDAGALVQIVTNLLQNALLHAFQPGREARIEVGMEAEVVGRVFDPFVTTKRNQGGSGLGLNIVYNLVTQRFRGDIGLLSKPGDGTVFTLKLKKD